MDVAAQPPGGDAAHHLGDDRPGRHGLLLAVAQRPGDRRAERVHVEQGDRRQRPDDRICRTEVYEPWVAALDGIDAFERIEVLYWLHQSRRDLVRQSPVNDGATRGTFSLRSPVRPNPIASSIVELVAIDGASVQVRGLDCLDGTPLVDLKPEHGAHDG